MIKKFIKKGLVTTVRLGDYPNGAILRLVVGDSERQLKKYKNVNSLKSMKNCSIQFERIITVGNEKSVERAMKDMFMFCIRNQIKVVKYSEDLGITGVFK